MSLSAASRRVAALETRRAPPPRTRQRRARSAARFIYFRFFDFVYILTRHIDIIVTVMGKAGNSKHALLPL